MGDYRRRHGCHQQISGRLRGAACRCVVWTDPINPAGRFVTICAFAPTYSLGISAAAARRGVGEDTEILFLPVNFEYAVGNWTVNGEFGYGSVQQGIDALGYGAAFGHPLGQRVQFMFEIYGGAERDFANNNGNFHLGLDIEQNPRLHWLMSLGAGLWEAVGDERLDYDFFLGIQYLTLGRGDK